MLGERRGPRHRYALGLLAACVAACATSPSTDGPPEAAARHQLVVEGLGKLSGARHTADRFGRRLEELLASGRRASARVEADLFPDLWLPVLFERPRHLPEASAFLARRFDAKAHGQGGWRDELDGLGLESPAVEALRRGRARFVGHMENGRFEEALTSEERLPRGAGVWASIGRAELRGWALRFLGRDDEARAEFERAAEWTTGLDRRSGDRYRLLAVAVTPERSRGARDRAAWSEIVRRTDLESLRHPEFLNLLLTARPVGAPWPPDCGERRVLARIGRLHLVRGEGEPALVALQRAESRAGATPPAAGIQLDQARALSLLGRTDAARTLCIEAAASEMRSEALVALGIVEVRADRLEQGRRWMQSALESVPVERAPILHADLALVELLCADDEAGMQRLAACKALFRRTHQLAELLKLLQNELAFHRAVGRTGDAAAVEAELTELEARPRVAAD